MEWYQWVFVAFLVVVTILCLFIHFIHSEHSELKQSTDMIIANREKSLWDMNQTLNGLGMKNSELEKKNARLQSAAKNNELVISNQLANIRDLIAKLREMEQSHIAERDDRLADMTKQRDNLAELVQRLRDEITDLDQLSVADSKLINEQAATIVELESQLAATSKTCHEYNDKLSEVHSRLCGIVSELQS